MKTPYDKIKSVRTITTNREIDGTIAMIPVVVVEFEKRSSILGDDAIFLNPADAHWVGGMGAQKPVGAGQ
jgi:hypothetical protein